MFLFLSYRNRRFDCISCCCFKDIVNLHMISHHWYSWSYSSKMFLLLVNVFKRVCGAINVVYTHYIIKWNDVVSILISSLTNERQYHKNYLKQKTIYLFFTQILQKHSNCLNTNKLNNNTSHLSHISVKYLLRSWESSHFQYTILLVFKHSFERIWVLFFCNIVSFAK